MEDANGDAKNSAETKVAAVAVAILHSKFYRYSQVRG
jgi:hypothetical protein